MVKQNVLYKHVNGQGEEVNIKLQFEHCSRCAYFVNCYGDGFHGPYFMDESCIENPVEKIESKKEKDHE